MCAESLLTLYVASVDGSLSNNLQNDDVSNLLMLFYVYCLILEDVFQSRQNG